MGRRRPSEPPRRPTRVKRFDDDLPVSEEARLLKRLARLGLGQTQDGRVHLPHLITRLAHRAHPAVFVGRMGGTRLEVRVRKGARLQIRVTFTPQVRFRKGWRLVTQLGLQPAEGLWA